MSKKKVLLTPEQSRVLRQLDVIFETMGIKGWKCNINYNNRKIYCYNFNWTDTWGCSIKEYTHRSEVYEIPTCCRFEDPLDMLLYIIKNY